LLAANRSHGDVTVYWRDFHENTTEYITTKQVSPNLTKVNDFTVALEAQHAPRKVSELCKRFFKSSILNKQSCLNLIVAGEKKPRNSWQVDTV